MKLSRLPLFLIPAILVGMLPACGKDSGKLKIAIVTNNPATFWTICEAGARKAAKENNVELIFRRPEKGDVGIQRQIIKSLTEQGVNGISISVIDPKEQALELKQVASKTKLVTMDNDADGSNRICYVGTDNYAAGREAGRLVKQVLPPGGGEVAIFVGQITPVNARLRYQGVVDELAGTGDRNVEGTPVEKMVKDKKIFYRKFGNYLLYNGEAITDGANEEEALKNAKGALELLGDRDEVCLVGLWAYNTPKNLEAANSKTFTKVKIVGFDENEITLKGIEDGRIHATVVQDPFNFGYLSVQILAAEAKGDTSKRDIKPIPYRIVTKDGGLTRDVDGVQIENIKATVFRDKLRELLDSVK
ncbi:MAG: substrate-binding domain-containing protein [Planctomycetes bacterium]|nr:substrate-binding domain-containing protein [Planctomycetota bacterium]